MKREIEINFDHEVSDFRKSVGAPEEYLKIEGGKLPRPLEIIKLVHMGDINPSQAVELILKDCDGPEIALMIYNGIKFVIHEAESERMFEEIRPMIEKMEAERALKIKFDPKEVN